MVTFRRRPPNLTRVSVRLCLLELSSQWLSRSFERFYMLSAGVVFCLASFALGSGAYGTEIADPCLNQLTIDLPNLCLNSEALRSPNVSKAEEKQLSSPKINLAPILGPPPTPDSKEQQNDLGVVLRAQTHRTSLQTSCAQADA